MSLPGSRETPTVRGTHSHEEEKEKESTKEKGYCPQSKPINSSEGISVHSSRPKTEFSVLPTTVSSTSRTASGIPRRVTPRVRPYPSKGPGGKR